MLYEIHIKGKNHIARDFIETIVKFANEGATIKEGTVARLSFPHSVVMTLESDTPPEATPFIRVFDEDKKEVRIIPLEVVKVPQEGGGFSMEVDPAIATNAASGKRWTKDELDAMEWEEFKAVCKADGFGGRDRAKMTKTYVDNSSK